MTATKRLKDCPTHTAGWRLLVNNEEMPPGTEWEVISRHGSIKTAVVTYADGTPNFDRPIVYEAPATNVVAWGWRKKGWFGKPEACVAVIRQPRPHADNPENQWSDGHAPVTFGQLPMGFREGKDEQGAVYRMCTANSLWLIFFATFPELWPR